jgi:hypothetical protein
MSLSDWQERGSFIPFDRPVDTPNFLEEEGQIAQVCFDRAWYPYIITCLKPLTREETWLESSPYLEELLQKSHTLIGDFMADCPTSLTAINWGLDIFQHTGSLGSISLVGGGAPASFSRYEAYSDPAGTFDIANCDIFGIALDNPDQNLGGHLTALTIEANPTGFTAFTLSVTDCLDGVTNYSDVTPRTFPDMGTFKTMTIQALTGIKILLTIAHPWVCGPA